MATKASIANISEVVYPSPSENSITLSSPVKRGREMVSRSTPDTMNIASSGWSISLSSRGLDTSAVVSMPMSFMSALNAPRSFQSSPYADWWV